MRGIEFRLNVLLCRLLRSLSRFTFRDKLNSNRIWPYIKLPSPKGPAKQTETCETDWFTRVVAILPRFRIEMARLFYGIKGKFKLVAAWRPRIAIAISHALQRYNDAFQPAYSDSWRLIENRFDAKSVNTLRYRPVKHSRWTILNLTSEGRGHILCAILISDDFDVDGQLMGSKCVLVHQFEPTGRGITG